MKILGHALAIGHKQHWQLMADHAFDHRGQAYSLVEFGQYDTPEGFLAERLAIGLVDVVKRVQTGGGTDNENAFEMLAAFGEQAQLLDHQLVALPHPCSVE